jgi:hypothetical protein
MDDVNVAEAELKGLFTTAAKGRPHITFDELVLLLLWMPLPLRKKFLDRPDASIFKEYSEDERKNSAMLFAKFQPAADVAR